MNSIQEEKTGRQRKGSHTLVKHLLIVTCLAVLAAANAKSVSAQPSQAAKGLKKLQITFINPGVSDINDPTGGFWLSAGAFMEAAAEDLDIDLEVIYCERDHQLMKKKTREVVSRKSPPDYLMVVNEKIAGVDMVKQADLAGVKVLMVYSHFLGPQGKEMGEPRQKYKNWIGSLIPDNIYAGLQMAQQIISEAKKYNVENSTEQIEMFAIGGDHTTQASTDRVEGLKQAVLQNPEVKLKRTVIAHWSKKNAYKKALLLLKQYPQTRAIWCANDPMAMGAIDAARESGREPGKDIFIGGANWDVPAMKKLQDGSMSVSAGGHFMTGAWGLIMIYDYHHGIDFKDEGLQLKRQIFGVLKKSNIDIFNTKFPNRNWGRIDFSQFSKVLNPEVKVYDFSYETVLQRVTQ